MTKIDNNAPSSQSTRERVFKFMKEKGFSMSPTTIGMGLGLDYVKASGHVNYALKQLVSENLVTRTVIDKKVRYVINPNPKLVTSKVVPSVASSKSVSCIGSRYTCTEFKLANGDALRVLVSFESDWIHSVTAYKNSLQLRKYRTRKFEVTSLDIATYLTNQQIYECYYNHWNQMNPLKLFSKLQSNSELLNFSVDRIPESQKLTVLRSTN